jgi:hypothetical protein
VRKYHAANGGQGETKVQDEGHEGWRLCDFVEYVNKLLKENKSQQEVTDDEILTLRMYTGSTYSSFNKALRQKGRSVYSTAEVLNDGADAPMPFNCCVQAARNALMKMQAIPRQQGTTYRGVTGFLDKQFNELKMGMDFAFFSTSTDMQVAKDFAMTAEKWVLFEVSYVAACRGVDIRILSVYPGEKEILFPPCTGLCMVGDGADNVTGIIKVIPSAAHEMDL